MSSTKTEYSVLYSIIPNIWASGRLQLKSQAAGLGMKLRSRFMTPFWFESTSYDSGPPSPLQSRPRACKQIQQGLPPCSHNLISSSKSLPSSQPNWNTSACFNPVRVWATSANSFCVFQGKLAPAVAWQRLSRSTDIFRFVFLLCFPSSVSWTCNHIPQQDWTHLFQFVYSSLFSDIYLWDLIDKRKNKTKQQKFRSVTVSFIVVLQIQDPRQEKGWWGSRGWWWSW